MAIAGSAGTAGEQQQGPLPQRMLGKTGVKVPVLGLGTAPAGHRPRKEATELFEQALDAGVTYMDTAPEFAGYGIAQKALGDAMKGERDRVFVVTKCFEPDGEKALELLKRNLRELRTDYADVVYAHSIGDKKMDLDTVMGKHGVLQALEKAKQDGLCRFVGISGHNRPDKFLKVLDQFNVEVMMLAVNYVVRHIYDFEQRVWPEARKKNVGLVAMKVLGGMYQSEDASPYQPKAKGGRIQGEQCVAAFRYAYGLPDVTTVVLGCYDTAELREAIGWVRDYQPLSQQEERQLLAKGKELADQWGSVYGPVK